MHACQGTEQTRAFQAYDGVGAHLRLEDKHRRLCTLVNTRDKEGEATNIRLIKKDETKEARRKKRERKEDGRQGGRGERSGKVNFLHAKAPSTPPQRRLEFNAAEVVFLGVIIERERSSSSLILIVPPRLPQLARSQAALT